MFEDFTVSDCNTMIEALDAWTTASRSSSMLAGLFLGSMICNGEKDRAEEGAEAVKKMTEGEDEKQKQREEVAILLKAKLIKLRDQLEVKELSKTI